MESGTAPKDDAAQLESGRLSAQLARLGSGGDMTVGSLVDAFGSEAFGAAIFVFAAPNLVPNPPGTSPILGLPLLLLSGQLVFGRDRIWLPDWMRRRHVSGRLLASAARGLGPGLTRLETLLTPRHSVLAGNGAGLRLVGLVSLPMAIILLLPLPFLHMLPGAAMACFGIGIAERDGLLVLAGHVLALATLLTMAAVVLLAHDGLLSLFGTAA